MTLLRVSTGEGVGHRLFEWAVTGRGGVLLGRSDRGRPILASDPNRRAVFFRRPNIPDTSAVANAYWLPLSRYPSFGLP